MKKFFTTCLFLALSAMTAGQTLAAVDNRLTDYEERRRTVAALMEAATVWIVGEDAKRISQGSGFLIGEGLIATNAHVVEGLDKGAAIYVLNDKLPATKAQIVAQARDSAAGRDFALLRFTPPKGVDLPVLAFNFDAKRMDRVSAWGYPAMVTQFDRATARLRQGDTRGLKAPPVVYTEGTINSVVNGEAGAAFIHSAQIAGGNSGGPLVNSRGEVVGINTWGYTEEGEGAFLNAALPAEALAAFLIANGAKPQLVSGQHVQTRAKPPATSGLSRPEKTVPPPPDRGQDDRVRDVGSFTVEVPRGWSVDEEEEDCITLVADDASSLVSIMLEDGEGMSLEETARELAGEYNTRAVREEDAYVFSFFEDDVQYTAVVGGMEDGRYVLVLVGGDADNPAVQEILNSVEDK